MEYYLLRKVDMDTLLSRQHPVALEIIQANRIVEPVEEQPNLAFSLMPGTHRHLMAMPACSLLTGSYDEPWFIDTGVSVDEGAVYIGRSDFVAMCNLAGFVEAQHLRDSQDRVAELERELSDLRSSYDDLSGAVARIREHRPDSTKEPAASPRARKSDTAA